jgi:hypothetical protein
VIVAVGEHSDLEREMDLIATALREYQVGQHVPVSVWRDRKKPMLGPLMQP